MKLSLSYINDIVDETCSRYNANMLDNQDRFGQIENTRCLPITKKMRMHNQTKSLQFQNFFQRS